MSRVPHTTGRQDTTLDQSQIAEFVNARCHQDEEDAVSAPPSRNHVVASDSLGKPLQHSCDGG